MQKTVRSRSLVALLLLLLTAGVIFVLGACAGETPPASETEADAQAQAQAESEGPAPPPEPETYTVRGEIVDLPDPEDPTSGFFVYHEAIDTFRGMDGKVVGMSSMTMPFAVDEELDLSGLERGDKVEFDLHVDWDGDPATLVTRVEKLPPDTVLEFRGAQPPGDDGSSEGEPAAQEES